MNDTEGRNDTETKPLVFRSTAARVGAWAWIAFTALNLVDLALRGRDLASLIAGAMLLLGCGFAYVFWMRPRIVGDESALTFHNPVRTVRVPWPALLRLEYGDAVRIGFEAAGREHSAQAWVLRTSPRARVRSERQAAKGAATLGPAAVDMELLKRTPGDYAVERLNELKAAAGEGAAAGGASVTWHRPALAALAVPASLVVAVYLVAVLS